ncbi:MAG: hypothetical protein AB8G23_05870 [Myxococcota bacterium]
MAIPADQNEAHGRTHMGRGAQKLLLFLLIGWLVVFFVPAAQSATGDITSLTKLSAITGGWSGALTTDDGFGSGIAALGDLNGDGVPDIAVGATGDDDLHPNAGAVYVLLLREDGSVLSEQKISALSGNFTGGLQAGDSFGIRLSGIGDLDLDGIPDLAVGALSGGPIGEGAIWILFLNADGTVKNEVELSGGLNGFPVIPAGAGLSAVASVGDLNGDSVQDLVVGAFATSVASSADGSVWVLFLDTTGSVIGSQQIASGVGGFTHVLNANDRFGYGLDSLGDVDGDGVTDIAVSAYFDEDVGGEQSGSLFVLFLNADGTVKSYQQIGDEIGGLLTSLDASDFLGLGLTNVGDLDGDGRVDLVATIPGEDNGGPDRGGFLELFLNGDGTVKGHIKVDSTNSAFAGLIDNADALGSDIIAVGDVDGDGVTDLAVSAISDDDGASGAGAVYILLMEGAAAVCGDGVFDPGEQCDDGNSASQDGCSDICRVEYRDYQIESLSAASVPDWYVVGDAVPDVVITLDVSLEEAATLEDFEVEFEWVAYTAGGIPWIAGPGDPSEAFFLGRELVPSGHVNRRPGYAGAPLGPYSQSYPLAGALNGNGSGETFEAWRSTHARLGNHYRLRAVIDPQNLVVEFPGMADANNTAVDSTEFNTLPLTGSLRFGSVFASILSAGTVLSTAGCAPGEVGVQSIQYDWNPSSNDQWTHGVVTEGPVVPLCSALIQTGTSTGFDVLAAFSSTVPTVTSTMAGLDVEVTNTVLSPSNAAPGSVVIDLPPDISYHAAEPFDATKPHPSGRAQLSGLSADQSAVKDFADLTASVNAGFLQAGSVPFSLRLNALVFTQNAVQGEFGDVFWRYAVDYLANDPRNPAGQNALKTNDRRYGVPETAGNQGSNSFTLDASGLYASVDFAASSGATHFPELDLNWREFTVEIEGTKLAADQSLSNLDTYELRQMTACPGCEAGGTDPTRDYEVDLSTAPGLGSDGSSLIVFDALTTEPAWGPAPNDAQLGQKTFQREGDSTRSGVIYIPGFLAEGTGASSSASVPNYLLGMRAAENMGGVPMPGLHYPLTHPQSKRGNHFMAGLTMGPEIYSAGTANQPQDTDFGEFLVGPVGPPSAVAKTIIRLPGPNSTTIPQSVLSNQGTKYVLRRGGVTGVFNTDTVPDPEIYGYNFDFERWAFRLAVNELDDFTWIDGAVSVDRPGDFNIAFTSLELMCTGDLGGGHVVRGDCAGDPAAPNCGETLHAWNSNFDVLTMTFEPSPPPASQCVADTRLMEVGSIVYPAAFDEPLGMVAQWYANGTPGMANFTGESERHLDRPENPATGENVGFDVALNQGVELGHHGEDEGWWEVTGTLGLPFWESLNVKARLGNENLASRKQSIVVDAGAALPTMPMDAMNTVHSEALSMMNDGGDGVDLSAQYVWGATGWEIPEKTFWIRYEDGHGYQESLDDLMPRFEGIQNSYNVVVLDLEAGTDFVTPEKTKVSFGASANFDLDVDIHIDVSDPDSVAEIDSFLDGFGLGRPIGDLLYNGENSFINRMNFMNEILGAGLSEVMKKAIEVVVSEAASEITGLAGGLEGVRSLPAQAAARITSELNAVVNDLPAPLTPELAEVVAELYNDLPPLLVAASASPPTITQEGVDRLNELADKIEHVLLPGLGTFQSGLGDAVNTAQNLNGDFTNVLSESVAVINTAAAALDDVVQFLDGSDLAGIGNSNPVVRTIDDTRSAIAQVRSAVGVIDLQQFSGLISSVSDVNIDGVAGAQRDILELLEDVDARLNEANQAIGSVIDGPGGMLNELTAPGPGPGAGILTVLQQQLSATGAVRQGISSLQQTQGGLSSALDLLVTRLNMVNDSVEQAEVLLADLQSQAKAAATGEPFNYSSASSVPVLQGRLNDAFQQATSYPFYQGTSFVTQLNDSGVDAASTAVGAVVGLVEAALAPAAAATEMTTPEQLEKMLVGAIMNSAAVEEVNNIANMYLAEIGTDMNGLSMMMLDQFNFLLADLFMELEGVVNDTLAAATSAIDNWGFSGAGLDGFALISGDQLERLHVSASFSQDGDTDESDMTYGASLDVTSWSAKGTADTGTVCDVDDPESRLDAVIAVTNIPIEIGAADIMLKKLYVGFTLVGEYPDVDPEPEAFFGGIVTEGEIDFEAFTIYDVQLHAGAGDMMGYAGARAGARFDQVQMEVAFLVGQTCDASILQALDPQAAEFIDADFFNGAFVRGSASIPIYNVGCLLTIGASADAGMWVLAGPPLKVGGIVGGGVWGEGACLVAIKGQITTFMQSNDGEFEFQGDGFVVGGLGFDCDPQTWTDVPKSRQDDFCATGDASFQATYKGSWNLGAPEFGAIY